ncbi:adult-specific rigid cuticular protein 15.7-like [Stegodyphus dumicola]|uniref:adult-specific rigid cuticular protein 15.7-like n=1 Tax=Stegodyphus dumicola TaxID=202533 RepID=UPI0015AF8509|nr:adult-specific rigid cuticular protein 15.7-like [Stegodyphus dumicola]
MIAKVVFLCAAFAVSHANIHLKAPLVSTGVSQTSRQQDAHGSYAFGYDIVDKHGASNSRSEVGDGYGNKKGTYTIHDIDGRARRVDYVADKLGFRAAVKTNEPGTAHSTPAAAAINSPYAGPSVDHIAPVATAVVGHAAVAAPVIAAAPVVAAAPVAYGGYGLGHGAATGLGYGAGTYGAGAYGGYNAGAYGGYSAGTYGAGAYGGHDAGAYGGYGAGTYGAGAYGGYDTGAYGGYGAATGKGLVY